jgi:hypothetical protein
MSPSPQPHASGKNDLSGVYAEDLTLYQEKVRRRLPAPLDELHGP